MRGLLIQEQYGVSPEETLSYVGKWIEMISPLLALRVTIKAGRFAVTAL